MRSLLARFGSPADVLSASRSALSALIGTKAAEALGRESDEPLIDATLRWLDAPHTHLITLADDAYPKALLQTADPPSLLYVHGNLELLAGSALAVVGSRNPTGRGAEDAHAFAHALSDAGLTIISGLALGIDAAAHRGGLQGSSSSIGVVGTGLDRVYPARNRDLAHELTLHGALVSELPLGTPAVAANFPRRNRIISGLARGCLVVEAALHSGSLITAREALEQGREVFAVPGSIHSPLAKGCHALIKQGAKLVESARDVLDELGVLHEQPMVSNQSDRIEVEERVADTARGAGTRAVLEAIGYVPFDLDTMCALTGLTPDAASAILLNLELQGYVERLPGGVYQRRR